MSKLEYPKCPYCGKKVSFLKSGFVISNSDFKCKACNKVSSVKVKHSVFGLIRYALLFTSVILILSVFFGRFTSLQTNILLIVNIVAYMMLPLYTELAEKDGGNAIETKEKSESEEIKE